MTNEELQKILQEEEHLRNQDIGRLVVKHDPRIDDDDSLMLTQPKDREIGIILDMDYNLNTLVYWQEQEKFETLWVGHLTYLPK